MTTLTVWYDTNGRVVCHEKDDSPASVPGYSRAMAETDAVGEITLEHVVEVVDDVVTKTTHNPPPKTDKWWHVQINGRREQHLNTSVTLALSDGDYVIPVTDRANSLAPEAARRARAHADTRPFPTDKGIIERGADDLDRITDALDTYTTKVWRRAGELERMVAAGTITESDLDTGWPE